MYYGSQGKCLDYPTGVPGGSFGCNLAQKLEGRVLTSGTREEMWFSVAAIEVAARKESATQGK